MATQSLSATLGDIPDIRILSSSIGHEQDLVVEVESALATVACGQCRRTIREFDGYDAPRKIRYLPPSGRSLYIIFRPKRFRCPYCDGHPITIQQINMPNS